MRAKYESHCANVHDWGKKKKEFLWEINVHWHRKVGPICPAENLLLLPVTLSGARR